MPIQAFECCGKRWEDLKSFSTPNPDFGKCPVCGKDASVIPSKPSSHRGSVNEHLMDPGELEMVRNNRTMLEKMHLSGDVDDGSYKIVEKGPNEFRPFGNDAFERKKAKEDAKVIH
jgi:hypothetical protein